MKKPFLACYLFFSICIGYSQGCSDAGFCSISAIQHQTQNRDSAKNNLSLGLNYGKADFDVSVISSSLEYARKLNDNFEIDLKLNFQSNSLEDVSVSALSDAFLIGNYGFKNDWKTSVGLKIPLNNGNLKDGEMILPMDFQPSLGTFDLLLGVSKKIKKINLSLAYQQPLTNNKNQYLASTEETFFSTKNFKRAGDILFRISYNWEIDEKFELQPSLLPIYHLANDKYTSISGIDTEIEKSSGLTLNGNLFLNYKFDTQNKIQLNFGIPFLVRDTRPDGLTRKFVVGAKYYYNF